MSKLSQAGQKRVRRMKREARRLLRILKEGKRTANAWPDKNNHSSLLDSAASRMEMWLSNLERRNRRKWPADRKRLVDAAQRAEDARKKVFQHHSS